MPKSVRSAVAASVALAVGALLLGRGLDSSGRPQSAPAAATARLAAEGKLRWYRGNLHTHSLWSDGDDYLEMIGLWYRDHGYDFLCFTDHNLLAKSDARWIDPSRNNSPPEALKKLKARFPSNWVEERTVEGKPQVRLKTFEEVRARIEDPGRFLLIQGEEISDFFARTRSQIHMNASNIQEAIPPMHGKSVAETIQNNADAVAAQRERTGKPILFHLNHPNFYWGVTAEDLMRIRGDNFFEVYNGHPSVHNSGDRFHASADRIWDIILAHRLADLSLPVMYGLATDDGHRYHHIPSRGSEPGRGWIMVLASELNADTIIRAIEAGQFYATCGVRLREVTSSPEGLDVVVDTEPGISYTIDFIGTRAGFDHRSEAIKDEKGKEIRATRHYSDEIGMTFKTEQGEHSSYRFQPGDLYVRARITSSKRHPNPSELGDFERAWVQPVRGPAVPGP